MSTKVVVKGLVLLQNNYLFSQKNKGKEGQMTISVVLFLRAI